MRIHLHTFLHVYKLQLSLFQSWWHIIYQMKARFVCITLSDHIIYRNSKIKNITNLIPPNIIKYQFLYTFCFLHIIFSVASPFVTDNHYLETTLNGFKSFKHNDGRCKTCFCYWKQLQIHKLVEYSKSHGMIHDKVLDKHNIIRNFRNPTTLCKYMLITSNISCSTNVFQSKIECKNYTWCPNYENCDSIICPAALQFAALSVIIWITFLCPTSFMTSFIRFAMKYLSLISLEQSIALRDIGPPSVISIKLIKGLLCESLHPSMTIHTPLAHHVLLVGFNNLSTFAFSLCIPR